MAEEEQKYFVEELSLNTKFRGIDINLEKYARTLKGQGYDIELIKHGESISCPYPATKDDYNVLLDPVRNFFIIEAETIAKAIEAFEKTFTIMERSLGISRASILHYSFETTLRVKAKDDKPAEMIAKATEGLRDVLSLNEYPDQKAEIGGFKIVTPISMIIIDVWQADQTKYLIRFVKKFNSLDTLKKFDLINFINQILTNIEKEGKGV